MIPGDFHQYKIRFEPLGFSIFTCTYILFSIFLLIRFDGTPYEEPETPSGDFTEGQWGTSKVHKHAGRHSAVSEVLIQIIPNVGL